MNKPGTTQSGRLVIVSNRLPFQVTMHEGRIEFTESPGGLVSGLRSFLDTMGTNHSPLADYCWVGWPGKTVDESLKAEITRKAAEEYHSHPVFLSESEMETFYHGFCNKTLWPLFHYFTSYTVYENEFWSQYQRVNEIFCDQLVTMIRPDDMIWIHDYHLMLLPRLLKSRTPNNPIGFFLHIPFPSFEVFRLLPDRWRKELLEGLLGADLIGFHTYDYTRHFFQCALRILGYEHHMGHVVLPYRRVRVDTFPMGIEFAKYAGASQLPEVRQEVASLKQSLPNVRIILSADRLDYTKGIPNRLLGFEHLLETNPQFRGNVVLLLVVVPSRIGVDHYELMKRQIEEMVGKINGKFGTIAWTPIIYQYKSLSFHPLSSLYAISDIALVTPLRDGMNLVAKEYIASRSDKRGVLILSEMAGAAKELGEAVIINPNNREEIAAAMKEALEMPEEEQARRNQIMQKRLRRYDVVRWATDFINQLCESMGHQLDIQARYLRNSHQKEMLEAYKRSARRLIFLDYDGTLISFTKSPSQAKPSERILKILNTLTTEDHAEVVIVSGRDRMTLSKWFGTMPLGLVAEHGAWLKQPAEEWKMLHDQSNQWKPQVLNILEQYADRLPGALIEEKEYSLSWHYRMADPEQSQIVARELTDHLLSFTENINLQVLRGNKVVEVRNIGVDKGRSALRWIQGVNPDFILSIGDDWTDEDLFRALPGTAYTVKVGLSQTFAKYNLHNPSDVLSLLERLHASAQDRRPT